MPTFTSTCRCCGERMRSDAFDAVWDHFETHSAADHDATFHRRPGRTTPRPAPAARRGRPAND